MNGMWLSRRKLAGMALAAAVLLGGCATTPVGSPDLLDFLEPGRTTREQVFLTLGQPSAAYEDEHILTYRLGQDEAGYYLVDRAPGFLGTRHSLVLSFDEAGVLRRHAVVALKGP